jgi:17beta-estradiol 17-dehydrogenase / very-long-chain 3-oxoacyl-CoA reductase
MYGEWVVITGATDGIGLEYAREFAKRGHSLVLVGRNETKLNKSKQELSRHVNPSKIATVLLDFNQANSQVC